MRAWDSRAAAKKAYTRLALLRSWLGESGFLPPTKCPQDGDEEIAAAAKDAFKRLGALDPFREALFDLHGKLFKAEKAKPSPSALADEWRSAIAAGSTRVSYSAKTAFKAGEIVEHPAFGAGIVKALPKPQRVLILFESGEKTLVCL